MNKPTTEMAYLSSVLEVMPNAVILFDKEGSIIAVNNNAENLFGYKRSEFEGKSFEHFIADFFLDNYFVKGSLSRPIAIQIIFGLHKSGKKIPLQINLSSFKTESEQLNIAVICDRSGKIHLEEEMLKQNYELIEATNLLNSIMLSTTGYSIVVTDLNGLILIWNDGARRNYGYSAEEVVGKKNILILNTKEDVKARRMENFFGVALKEGKTEGVFDRVRKNGDQFTALVTMTLRKSAYGVPVGYVMVSKEIDISAHKWLEKQLKERNEELEHQNRLIRQANRLKSEFLANMSHELRTPLNAIIGFTQLIHSGKVGLISSEQKEYLGDILSSSHHLLQLINDALDLAKVEAGKMEFRVEPVSISKMINEVRDILRTLIAKKHIHLEIQIDPSVDKVKLDPSKFKQIIYNFVSNSIKFTENKGKISLRVTPEEDDKFLLVVKDNGIGIGQEDIKKLFIEFQQLDVGKDKKFLGTGLGLALTRRIIEAQGGTVHVNSKLGKGSTFYATLPKYWHSTTEMQDDISKSLRVKENAPTILVIEDDAQERLLILNNLLKAGYQVMSATTGSEAILYCHEQKFDAITLDLLMPDMSGWDILRAFRSEGLNQTVPVIVVSVVAEKSASLGFAIQDFITKPLNPNDLLSALKRANIKPDANKSILIVDDNPQDLKLAKTILSKLGYSTICESNGESALASAQKQAPDVVVLDLIMPGMSGFEFLQKFRQVQACGNVPVIVWTSKDLTEEDYTLLHDSASKVVLKGEESASTLLSEIENCLLKTESGKYKNNRKTSPSKS